MSFSLTFLLAHHNYQTTVFEMSSVEEVKAKITRYGEKLESLDASHPDFIKFEKLLEKERAFLLALTQPQNQGKLPTPSWLFRTVFHFLLVISFILSTFDFIIYLSMIVVSFCVQLNFCIVIYIYIIGCAI